MNKKTLIVAGIFSLGLVGCGSNPPKQAAAACVYPGTTVEAQGWVCDEPVEGVALSAVGSATKSAAGPAFMKQMAATDARVQLAQIMKVQVANMVKQYVETTGAADSETVDKVNTLVTKQITEQTVAGSRIYKSTVAPDGTMYVLVGLDDNTMRTAAQQALRTSMNNEQAAWQQFKAKQGFDELAAEIAKQKAGQ